MWASAGWGPKVRMGSMSQRGSWMSLAGTECHGGTGRRDGGRDSEGAQVPIHPRPGFHTLPDLTQSREIKEDYNSRYASQLLCVYLGSCSSLKQPCVLLFPRALLMGGEDLATNLQGDCV